MPQAADANTTPNIHPHLLTTYAENGEVDLLMTGDRLVLSACEERPCGCDRVHSRKLDSPAYTSRRRRPPTCARLPVAHSPRSGQWSDTALAAMAQEFAR